MTARFARCTIVIASSGSWFAFRSVALSCWPHVSAQGSVCRFRNHRQALSAFPGRKERKSGNKRVKRPAVCYENNFLALVNIYSVSSFWIRKRGLIVHWLPKKCTKEVRFCAPDPTSVTCVVQFLDNPLFKNRIAKMNRPEQFYGSDFQSKQNSYKLGSLVSRPL